MEIKNKNIFLNLNEGEEIVYVAEKNKFNFYWNFITLVIVGLPLISFFTVLIIFEMLVGSINTQMILSAIFMFLIFILFWFMAYKIVSDYFFTELLLTNQRFIISRFNKIKFINYEQVKRITGTYGYRGGPIQLTIRLKNKKFYSFFFIDRNVIRNKFKEICPEYDDLIALEKEKKQGLVIIVLLLLAIPFVPYLVHKFSPRDNTNNQQIIEKHKKHSNDPKLSYFDSYMNNLQNKIKSNWSPPKSKVSKDVILKFKIARDGSLVKTKIIKSSDDTATDMAAIEALKKSAPFEPLPKQCKDNSVDVEFTFDYNVLNR